MVFSDRIWRNDSKMQQVRFRPNTRQNFFTDRETKHWTRFPRGVVNALTLRDRCTMPLIISPNVWSALKWSGSGTG